MARIQELEQQLAAARADQARDEERLSALAAGETEAARDPAAFEKWSRDRATLNAAIERRLLLIPVLEKDLGRAREHLAVLVKRRDEKATANPALAKRFQARWSDLTAELMNLVNELVVSALEDDRVNRELAELGGDGRSPLITADYLARALMPQPEKIVKTSRVKLWCNEGTYDVIGDQNSVRDRGGGRGVRLGTSIPHDFGNGRQGTIEHQFDCVLRNFEETHIMPEIWVPWPSALWVDLRLPSCDRAELLFDGSRYASAEAASIALQTPQSAKPKAPRRVPIIRLRPLPDDDDASDAERAARAQQLADAGDVLNGE